MISIVEAISIHDLLIQRYGGSYGIRDKEALLAALARPYQTFGELDLYPSSQDKAAAILESILTNHPFLDGNKRLGFVLMKLILLEAGLNLQAPQNELYDFIIRIASGQMDIRRITEWIQQHVTQVEF